MEESVAVVRTLLADVGKCLGAIGESRSKDDAFNVCRLCKVDHYENAHSRIIAEFLNPRGTHGIGDVFLRLFLRQPVIADYLKRQGFPEDDGFHGWETMESAMVVAEEAFPDGRCDIAIHWRGWCIVIENKIYAADQARQLERYAKAVLRTGEKPIVLYLTLDGHSAGTDSVGDVNYKGISYRKENTPDLQNAIGQMYAGYYTYKGYAPKDEELAVDWFMRAAKVGHADAMDNLGNCYKNGDGVEKDEELAAAWYSKAANAGLPWGHFHYADVLEDGKGVPKDDELAVAWYLKAATQGLANDQRRLPISQTRRGDLRTRHFLFRARECVVK